MTPTETIVAAAFQRALEAPALTCDSDFFELGGDSFVAVNLALMLEDKFQIELPAELLEEVSTIAAMAAWIEARLASR